MDALFLVLVGAVGSVAFALEVGAFAVLIESAVVVLSALLSLAGRPRRRPETRPRARLRLPHGLRRALWITAVLGLLIALLAQFVFFEPVVRLLVSRRPDVQLEFAHATGNLFTGQLTLTDVHLRRDDPQRGDFDLTIRTLAVDLSVLGVWSDELPLESLLVEGVRGSYQRFVDVAPGTPFRTADLTLRDVQVEVDLAQRAGAPATRVALQLDEWHSQPFRSRRALLDCMLHSSGAGQIASRPFTVGNGPAADGSDSHESRLQVEGLPVPVLAEILGGPIRLLDGGTADVDVRDRWQPGSDEQIDLHWHLVLRDLTARAPADLDPLWTRMVPRVVDWLGKHAREVPLDFQVRIEGGKIDWSSSEAARQLGYALWNALARELAGRAGMETDVIEAMGKAAKTKASELLHDFLQRRKK